MWLKRPVYRGFKCEGRCEGRAFTLTPALTPYTHNSRHKDRAGALQLVDGVHGCRAVVSNDFEQLAGEPFGAVVMRRKEATTIASDEIITVALLRKCYYNGVLFALGDVVSLCATCAQFYTFQNRTVN